jgi:hypothetical protein
MEKPDRDEPQGIGNKKVRERGDKKYTAGSDEQTPPPEMIGEHAHGKGE